MDKMKPWQIGLFIAAVVVLGASLAWGVFGGERMDLKEDHVLVDVTNGDRFTFNTGGRRGMALPEINPETGEAVLLPIRRSEEDDQWEIIPRARGMLDDLPVSEQVVRSGGALVNLSERSPRRLRP
jgi:hypothetical protein